METNADLYRENYFAWIEAQRALLRQGWVQEIDADSLAAVRKGPGSTALTARFRRRGGASEELHQGGDGGDLGEHEGHQPLE